MAVSLKRRLFYFFPILFCFCMPFGLKVASVIIALWVISSFFNLNLQAFKQGIKNNNVIIFLLFMTVTIVSAFASNSKTEAFFGIEVKLSFIFLPYLFFCFYWPINLIKRCVVSYVSGCFFACVYLIVRAFYYSLQGHSEYFFYTLFSELMHPSYFAMYLIMAIVFVILLYGRWFSLQKNILFSSYFFVFIFVVSIFLCSSKLGIISTFITLGLLILHKWKKLLNLKKVTLVIVCFFLLLIVSVKVFPNSFNRLKSLTTITGTIDKTSSESTAVRLLIWQQSVTLIKQHFLFGTGVGDANDELYKAYEANGLTGALTHKLNAHNQFFQTFIGLGILGFSLLLLLTFGQLIKAVLKKNFLLFIFSLIIILNFLVESMLQTSAGVLFFVFFLCLFNLVDEKKLISE